MEERTRDYRDPLDEAYTTVLARYLRPGAAILELEAARGNGAERLLCQRIPGLRFYVCVDLARKLRENQRTENDCLIADCRHLPFREHLFDLVHVTFPSRGDSLLYEDRLVGCTFASESVASSLAGVTRVLKKDGYFVIFPFLEVQDAWQARLEQECSRQGYRKARIPLLDGRYVAVFRCDHPEASVSDR